MPDIQRLHRQLIAATHGLETDRAADDAVIAEYERRRDTYVEQFEAENAGLVERHAAAVERRTTARTYFETARDRIKEALTGEDRIHELPEGLKQTKEKVLRIDETFSREEVRDIVMRECPALMMVDMAALEKLAFNHAEDNGTGGFNLPHWIQRLGVHVDMHYKASISDATLKKLPLPEPVPEEAAVLDDTEDFTHEVDPLVVLKNGDTKIVHIIKWTREDSPEGRWSTITREGETGVIIQKHRVARIANFALFQDAGYGEYLEALTIGQSQDWDVQPVQVEIQKAGDFWRILRVTPGAFFGRTARQQSAQSEIEARFTLDEVESVKLPEPVALPKHKELALVNLRRLVNDHDMYVLDTETTGLGSTDEVVQIAIVHGFSGEVVLNTLVRPTCAIHPEALAIHHITDDMVQDAPRICDLMIGAYRLHNWLNFHRIVTYNAEFDVRLLRQAFSVHDMALIDIKSECAMLLYAQYRGVWNAYKKGWRWAKQEQALEELKLTPEEPQHSALADALNCRNIMREVVSLHEVAPTEGQPRVMGVIEF